MDEGGEQAQARARGSYTGFPWCQVWKQAGKFLIVSVPQFPPIHIRKELTLLTHKRTLIPALSHPIIRL